MLRNKQDVGQIAIGVLSVPAIMFATYFSNGSFWQVFTIWIFVWIFVCRNNYILHNHIHSPFFTNRNANKFLEIILACSTGMPAGNWLLMHKHGHHVEHKIGNLHSRRYIRPFIVKDDAKFSQIDAYKYAITYTIRQMYVPFSLLVNGLITSKFKRRFCAYYLLDYVILFAWLAVVFSLSIQAGISLAAIYLLVTFFSLVVDYITHAGEHLPEEHSFANTCEDPVFNRIFWNFGYHVAHHAKPNLHWTQLPNFETKLVDRQKTSRQQGKILNVIGFMIPPHFKFVARPQDTNE